MGKLKTKLLLFKNAGYQEDIYLNYDQEINIQNRKMVISGSFIGMAILGALTLASLFIKAIGKLSLVYFVVGLLFLVIFLLAKHVEKDNDVYTLVLFYLFLTVSYFFAIAIDAIQRNETATTICVLLVALPLLIVDKPWRQVGYFSIITIIFILEVVFIKRNSHAAIDIVNAIVFLIIGIYVGYQSNKMIVRNIINQRLLKNQRDIDTLTALYNKGAMENKVVKFLKNTNVTASMMVIDLDNFKCLNDTYGHAVGDEILAAIGKLLVPLFRSSDLISRFGGDEFIIFLPMSEDTEILASKAEAILQELGKIRISQDPDYRVNVCIGIATYPKDGSSYDELFKRADTAMYRVKKNGKNSYGFYK